MSSPGKRWAPPTTADASGAESNQASVGLNGQNPMPPRGRATVPMLRAIAVAGPLAVAGAGGFVNPPLRTVTMAIDLTAVAVVLVVLLVLMIVIVFGSDQRCNRVFRLLRWLANRPEPPAPDSMAAGQKTARPQKPRKASVRPVRSTTLVPASRDLPSCQLAVGSAVEEDSSDVEVRGSTEWS